ncbi:MAG: hypothetical protein LQ346_003809 [Caloplaca aetnensis]|nr:MAG: hypothetical protein LQ346_003809 [Caloplaca aetnensis]
MASPCSDSSVDRGANPAPLPTSNQDKSPPPLSKNQLKKLRRDQAWEEGRERRKALRKLKNKEKKERKRADAEKEPPAEPSQGKRKATEDPEPPALKKAKHHKNIQLPVSFVVDCGFDDLMLDGERKSLASQVTRSYSDNHKAPFRSHLFISSFKGHLKERFDTVLAGNHRNWKGVKFIDGDFEEAAQLAEELMKISQGGKLAGTFQKSVPAQQMEDGSPSGEVVYLTSDSPDILTELKPYSTYIIGGIVDKNRHKGICYKRATDRGMKTAKLPIGDYMKMTSRFVLATNHVVEIMLRWLELGDWAKAFLQVIPKRKGGILKDGAMLLERRPPAAEDDAEKHSEPSTHDEEDQNIPETGAAESSEKDTAVPSEEDEEQQPP